MPFSPGTLPTSGTYTLKLYVLANAPYEQGPGLKFQTVSVTYIKGGFQIGGTTYTYKNAWTWGGDPTGDIQKGVILDVGGQPFILVDPSFPAENYKWTVQNPITNNISAEIPGSSGTSDYDSLYFAYDNAIRWSGKCFLRGTMISTPSGHIAVEDMLPGMDILVFNHAGEAITQKIQWVGKGELRSSHTEDNMEKTPVRIIKDAFAENVPFKDCLLTPEHCVYLEGCFVPVRMLVNDRSIYYDISYDKYEYFHIELPEHSVIQSDGMFSESYLNTDEAVFFFSEGKSSEHFKSWQIDAAAPLQTDQAFVEPLYKRFSTRADKLNAPLQRRKTVSPSEPYITDKTGKKKFSSIIKGNRYIFEVHDKCDDLFISSVSSKPSEFLGPFIDDRRNLGLLVGEITIITPNKVITYTDHLEEQEINGWHSIEQQNKRWTNGNARLINIGEYEIDFIIIEIIDKSPSVKFDYFINDFSDAA